MKIVNRRTAAAAVAATLLPFGIARAQSRAFFPSRTISLVVGFPAGGATDVTARVALPHLQKSWGQTVIVENLPGAGGSIGVQKMLNAAPEGHVLFLGTASDTVLAPLAIQSARYQPEDLRLLGYMGQAEFVIVARPGLAVNSLDELVAHMRASPSKELSYASFGNGSIYHLIGEDLKNRAGGQLLHVPFQGMGPTVTNLIGNQVDLAFMPVAGQTVGLINSGRVKPIALTGPGRNPQLPHVASVDESRHMKGFHHTVWLGLFGPAALPAEAATKVNAAVNDAIRTPEYLKFSAENGTRVPDPGLTLQQAAKFYADDTEKLRRLARSIKLEAT